DERFILTSLADTKKARLQALKAVYPELEDAKLVEVKEKRSSMRASTEPERRNSISVASSSYSSSLSSVDDSSLSGCTHSALGGVSSCSASLPSSPSHIASP